jgi:hypothetical protein
VNLNWFLVLMLSMGPEVLLKFFLAEYASILFMRLLFCIIFWGCNLDSLLFYIRLSFIWIRGTLPFSL